MPFVPWVVLWVVIANFPRMDVICIWTVMTTTGITLIINCVQLEHQRLSIVGRVEKGRSKRTPTYPWSRPQASPNLQMKGIPSQTIGWVFGICSRGTLDFFKRRSTDFSGFCQKLGSVPYQSPKVAVYTAYITGIVLAF